MSFIFTYSRDALSVFINGVPRTVDSSHPKWEEIFQIVTGAVAGTEQDLITLLDFKNDVAQKIAAHSGKIFGRVSVGFESIMLDGKPMHNELTKRMLEMIQKGFDIAPMARFMDKLYSNPSHTAVNELFLWLESSNLPIVENGNFLAYKKVRDDYGSFHDGGKTMNKIGTIVEMPRNEVDDNRDRTCSNGLHFCSWSYLPNFYGSQGRVVILEIDPADVVSIPSDYNNAKGRAWRYLVRGEIDQEEAKFAFPSPVAAVSDYDDQWGYDEDEDEEQSPLDALIEKYGLVFDESGRCYNLHIDTDDWESDIFVQTSGEDGEAYTTAWTNIVFGVVMQAFYDEYMEFLYAVVID